jgi:hypothetical protein
MSLIGGASGTVNGCRFITTSHIGGGSPSANLKGRYIIPATAIPYPNTAFQTTTMALCKVYNSSYGFQTRTDTLYSSSINNSQPFPSSIGFFCANNGQPLKVFGILFHKHHGQTTGYCYLYQQNSGNAFTILSTVTVSNLPTTLAYYTFIFDGFSYWLAYSVDFHNPNFSYFKICDDSSLPHYGNNSLLSEYWDGLRFSLMYERNTDTTTSVNTTNGFQVDWTGTLPWN